MTNAAREGDLINLYKQDFRDVRAYATSLAGKVFFAGIEGGAILEAAGAYSEESPTVYLGKPICNDAVDDAAVCLSLRMLYR